MAENLAQAGDLIDIAANQGAKFIATPEMTHLMQRDGAQLRRDVRLQDEDLGVAYFAEIAKALNIYLLIGSMAILRPDGQIVNRSFLFDPEGKIRAQYDKIHLFEAKISKTEIWREADSYAAGKDPVITQMDGINVGFSICYDLRFADLYQHYAKAHSHIITVPSAFTRATGKAHWEILLRARAIETGAYIIAPAQGGFHEDGRKTWGRSMIIGPWGEIIAHLDHDTPGYMLADIDMTQIHQAREKIPAWKSAS